MTPEKAHMLRCASSFVVAAYAKNTPHFSGLARLASGAFCDLIFELRMFSMRLNVLLFILLILMFTLAVNNVLAEEESCSVTEAMEEEEEAAAL
jgi:hypothetical protein